jgi:hypothetical protein
MRDERGVVAGGFTESAGHKECLATIAATYGPTNYTWKHAKATRTRQLERKFDPAAFL